MYNREESIVFLAEELNRLTGDLLKANERELPLLLLKTKVDCYGGFDLFTGLIRLDYGLKPLDRDLHYISCRQQTQTNQWLFDEEIIELNEKSIDLLAELFLDGCKLLRFLKKLQIIFYKEQKSTTIESILTVEFDFLTPNVRVLHGWFSNLFPQKSTKGLSFFDGFYLDAFCP